MKLKRFELVLASLLIWGAQDCSYGFDVAVHDKITEAAVNASANLANYLLDNNVDPLTEYNGMFVSVEGLIRFGSIEEDNVGTDAGGARPLNHFYDPTTKRGLSVPGPIGTTLAIGLPSTTWAAISNANNPLPKFGGFNQYAWQNTRAYQSNSIVNLV